MKGRLARAVASTAEHGRARSRIRRWIRWLPGHGGPPDLRFQGLDEPYPRHWRTSPTPWPTGLTDAPAVRQQLRHVVQALPTPWRTVLLARDGAHLPAEQVAADLGVTVAQQRRILNRARAAVRDALANRLAPGADR